MWMVRHRRAPAVEHGGGANAGAEVLGVGGDGEQRLGRGAEQEVVDNRLVLVGDRSDLGRQGEDQVEIADRQQIGLAGGEPVPRRRALALGTMAVATRVVGNSLVAAVFAALDMAAEDGRAAVLDGRHHLELAEADVPGIGLAPGGAVAMEDVCALQFLAAHGRRLFPGSGPSFGRLPEPVEPAGYGADRGVGDAGVTGRGVELGVAEQHLDDAGCRYPVRADAWRSCAARYA